MRELIDLIQKATRRLEDAEVIVARVPGTEGRCLRGQIDDALEDLSRATRMAEQMDRALARNTKAAPARGSR